MGDVIMFSFRNCFVLLAALSLAGCLMDDLEVGDGPGGASVPGDDPAGSDLQTAEQPIFNGFDDTVHDPVVRVGGCTGTFIAPNFIITAQHCLPSCDQYPASTPALAMFACYDGSPGPPWHTGSRSGIVAGRTARGGLFANEGPVYHIDFAYVPNDTTFTPWPYGTPDVSILHTVESYAGAPMAVMGSDRMPRASNIASYESGGGEGVVIVGYSNNAGHDDSRRRWGFGRISGHDPYGRSFQVNGSALNQVGCPGDSGGPALTTSARGTDEVAGVVSLVPNCNPGPGTNPPTSYTTTYAYIPRDFLDNVLCGDGWEFLGAHPDNAAAASHSELVRLSEQGVVCRAERGVAHTGRVVVIRDNAQRDIVEFDANAESWWLIDDNPASREIAVSANHVYQRHASGYVWRWDGGFRRWTQIDYSSDSQRRLAVDDQYLYEIDGDGSIWKYDSGWYRLDANPASTQIAAGDFGLVQMHGATGAIWRYDPASGGWGLLIQSSAIVDFAVGDVLTLLTSDGSVLNFNGYWSFIAHDSTIGSLVVRDGDIYRMHDAGSQDGNVFRYLPQTFGWLNLGGRGHGADAIFGSVGL
jgi:hypothetical protein